MLQAEILLLNDELLRSQGAFQAAEAELKVTSCRVIKGRGRLAGAKGRDTGKGLSPRDGAGVWLGANMVPKRQWQYVSTAIAVPGSY